MTTEGWIFMIAAWTAVSVALGWCFYQILKSPKQADPGPPSGRM